MDLGKVFKRENAAPGAFLLMFAAWLTQESLTQSSFWTELPLGWFALIAFAFWMGQDLYHPTGRLRLVYERFRSFGDFQSPGCEIEHFNLGDNYGGQQTFTAIYVPIRFSKTVLLDFIRIKSRIYRYRANKLENWLADYEWNFTRQRKYLIGDSAKIPIAFIPHNAGNPGVYGDKKIEGYYLGKATVHFLTIELKPRSGHTQTKELQLLMPSDKPSVSLTDGVESGGRFLLFEEWKLPSPANNEA